MSLLSMLSPPTCAGVARFAWTLGLALSACVQGQVGRRPAVAVAQAAPPSCTLTGHAQLSLRGRPGAPIYATISGQGEVALPPGGATARAQVESDGLTLTGWVDVRDLTVYNRDPLLVDGYLALAAGRPAWIDSVDEARRVRVRIPAPRRVRPSSPLLAVLRCEEVALSPQSSPAARTLLPAAPAEEPSPLVTTRIVSYELAGDAPVPLSRTPDSAPIAVYQPQADPAVEVLDRTRSAAYVVIEDSRNVALAGWIDRALLRRLTLPRSPLWAGPLFGSSAISLGRWRRSPRPQTPPGLRSCDHDVPVEAALPGQRAKVGWLRARTPFVAGEPHGGWSTLHLAAARGGARLGPGVVLWLPAQARSCPAL